MRISDWSSDVCSSDLLVYDDVERPPAGTVVLLRPDVRPGRRVDVYRHVATAPAAHDLGGFLGAKDARRAGCLKLRTLLADDPEAATVVAALGKERQRRNVRLSLCLHGTNAAVTRSEEPTFELQSL